MRIPFSRRKRTKTREVQRSRLFLEVLEDRVLLDNNPIPAENALTGTPQGGPNGWGINSIDQTVSGFTTDISYNVGQTVSFKVSTPAASYHLSIYRMGYYQGNGARLITTIAHSGHINQPGPATDSSSGLNDYGTWAVSDTWQIPTTAVSGLYFAKLVRDDTGGASHIWWVVRNDASTSDLLVQTSDETWEAYNQYGGNSLYFGSPGVPSPGDPNGRAYKVSYNRPWWDPQGESDPTHPLNAEYPMIRFLEANGYNVSYFTHVDVDRLPNEIRQHKVYISSGHDEYWSGLERTNVQAARDNGVNLAFFSGNTIFWKTYWQNSIDGSNTAYRTVVCYKDTHDSALLDPQNPNIWTGTWRDPRFSPPADGGQPENALVGSLFTVNGPDNRNILVPAAYAQLRFWKNTAVAALQSGQTVTLANNTLGYEWGEDLDNGFRPAGTFDLSSSTYNVPSYVRDYGSTYTSGTATHHLTEYRAASGALVFATCSVQWAWGLDGSVHGQASDANMQQATVNLFADMGAQPATLQAGLVAATASTDHTPPTSTITSPAAGATLASGTPVTLTGTATDAGGGVVAGVEVSTDGGATWHPASIAAAATTVTWTYTWNPVGSGNVTVRTRAVDDSANLETPGPGVTYQLLPSISIFPSTAAPVQPEYHDTHPSLEFGVKFRSDISGKIAGVRFYKSPNNLGLHSVHLWANNGTLLASGSSSFTTETPTGWQTVFFSTPVTISTNTTYVASYHIDSGYYPGDDGYFVNNTVTNGPLHALADGVDGPNGVYIYGPSAFPTSSYQADNYWVDVVFVPPTVGSSTTLAAAPNPTTFGQTITLTAQVQPSQGTGTPTGTVTFKDGSTVLGTGTLNGSGQATFQSWSLSVGSHPLTAVYAGDLNFAPSTSTAVTETVNQPTGTTASTTNVVSSTNPSVSGQTITFTATVNVASGTATGAVTFKDGTTVLGSAPLASGHGTFSTGLAVGAHSITAVYSGDNTFASSTSGALTQTVNQAGTVTTLASSVNPSASGSAVVFTATVSAAAPGTGTATGTVTFKDGPTTLGTGTLNAGQATYSTSGLSAGSHSITAVYSGDANFLGSTSSVFTQTVQSSFTIWPNTATPIQPEYHDSAPSWELGLKFRSDVTGQITGIRFYKSTNNTGTHTAHLWTSTGTLLASAAFTSETATGWQSVSFGAPVTISPNTTYVASYHLDSGYYVGDDGYFTNNTVTSGPLHALADGVDGPNGVYAKGPSAFPTSSYQADNYWVDVTFLVPSPTATTSTLAVAPNPTTYGQTVTLTAQVQPSSGGGTPTGTVTFKDGSTVLSSGTLNASGQATYTTWSLAVGSHSLTAVYSGDNNFTASTSAAVTETINQPTGTTASTTSVVSSANPAVSGQSVTFTATVSVASGTPTGAVTFKDGATVLGSAPLGSGHATLTVGLAIGSHSITAVYSGDNTFASSTSTALTQTVNQAGTSTTLVSSANPINTGNSVTFTATVSVVAPGGGTPTGTVTFKDGATTLGTGTLNAGQATYSTSSLSAGSHSITAVYGGDGNYLTSTSPTLSEVVQGVVTIWPNTATPIQPEYHDSAPSWELGLKFRSDVAGQITSIRFYKSTNNTGTHTGHLWTSTGTLLASATFTNETATGWQSVSFGSPVTISPNTTYVASYHLDSGYYVGDDGYFTNNTVTSGPLHALADGVDGPNGVYAKGPSAFPTSSYQADNYWVDVVMVPVPAVTATTPSSGAGQVAVNTAVTVTFSEAMDPTTINNNTIQLKDPSGNAVPAAVSYNSSTNTATLTPTNSLAADTVYNGTVLGGSSGVKDLSGSTLPSSYSWSFFTDGPAPVLSSYSPPAGATGLSTTTTVQLSFNHAMDSTTITASNIFLKDPNGNMVPASISYNAGNFTATLTPSSSLSLSTTYTATVLSNVRDLNGRTLAATTTWSFTTMLSFYPSLWTPSATPQNPASTDGASVNLGVKFYSDIAGTIKGIRFYKGSTNTGTHVGSLWNSSGGAPLASATFTNETASGWQQVTFASPVAISAGVTYVASYLAPNGHYAEDQGYFSNAVNGYPLHAPSSGAAGGNCVYAYASTNTFPSQTFNSSNYWVDVVFSAAPIITSKSPAPGATGVSTTASISFTFDRAMNAATINTSTIILKDSSGNVVPVTISYNSSTYTVTVTPTSALKPNTTYTITVKSGSNGVADIFGNFLAQDLLWSFTTGN
jgi:hypothetical protein